MGSGHSQSHHAVASSQDSKLQTAGRISLAVSIVLLTVKMIAYDLTRSQAILSDALESIVNVIAAVVALMVIRFASQPADRDHPYGHGKAEFFSAGFEGGAISLAGITIVLSAARALWEGTALNELQLGIALVVIAGLANGALGLYLVRTGKRLHSAALEASGRHVLSDFWTTVGIVLGLVAVKLTGLTWLDPVLAIIVGVKLTYTGFQLLSRSSSVLMDAEDRSLLENLGKIFSQHVFPGIIRIHHTRVIRSGRYHHIDLHIVIPEFWTVEKAHEESTVFESKVMKAYPNEGELHAHLDPCRQAYCKMCEMDSCPVRREDFVSRQPFTVEELTSPEEPVEILDIKGVGKVPPH